MSGLALRPHLLRFGRRLRLRDGWTWAQHTLWTACLAAVCVQLIGRALPIAGLWGWTLAPLVVWLLVVSGMTLFRPVALGQTGSSTRAGGAKTCSSQLCTYSTWSN